MPVDFTETGPLMFSVVPEDPSLSQSHVTYCYEIDGQSYYILLDELIHLNPDWRHLCHNTFLY